MKTPPETIYYVTMDRQPDEQRTYYTKRFHRLHAHLSGAMLFFRSWPRRPKRLYKGTVVWEEVEVSG